MRFVYYGHFDQISDCEGWIATTLERQGHYVFRSQRDQPNRGFFPVDRILAALIASEADFLLLSKVPECTADDLRIIKDAGFKIVFWTFDWMKDPSNWIWYAPLAQVADICFQTDGYGEPEYAEAGIRRVELHQGAFTDLHRPVMPTDEERKKFTADVAFCGSLYTPRRHELDRELQRYNYKLWGPATEQLWGRSFAAMVACTKIIVCDNYVNDVPGYWSDRVYLTMACGGFVAASWVQGITNEFRDEESIVLWDNFQRMHDVIGRYLKADKARFEVRYAGFARVVKAHTYTHRIQKFIQVLEEL